MRSVFVWIRGIAAGVLGYAIIALLTTLVFREFHGLGYHESSAVKLVLGGAFISAAGFVGGCIAGWLGGRATIASAAVVLLLIFDSSVVISRELHDPLWFSLLSAVGLIGATIIGVAIRPWLALRCSAGAQNLL